MPWRPMRKLSGESETDVKSDAAPRGSRPRPGDDQAESERRRRLNRRVTVLLIASFFVVFSAAALFAEGGYFDLVGLHGQRDQALRDVTEQQARVDALRRQVGLLQTDPLARERIAREQLGYARKGEVTIILPRDPAEVPEWLAPLPPAVLPILPAG